MAPTVMLVVTKQYTRTFCVYSSSYEFDLVCRRLCWPPILLSTWNNASLWKKVLSSLPSRDENASDRKPTRLCVGQPINQGLIFGSRRSSFLLQSVHSNRWAPSVSYSKCIGDYFLRNNAVRPWSWPFIST